jgi:class IV lanthipeptide synthase
MDAQQSREEAWQSLISAHLPVTAAESIWCYSGPAPTTLPRQGWKLHVSATIDSAYDVLAVAAEVLTAEGVLFKAVKSLGELARLNCGLFYGYPQVGKFLTAYPPDPGTAARTARRLAEATSGMAGPRVPFEHQVAPDAPVYARYGSFRSDAEGDDASTVTGPDGAAEPDRRDQNPSWAEPPDDLFQPLAQRGRGLLATTYRAYAPLMQRGKGGVYRAVDLGSMPPRHCVLKEGRRHGEVDATGQDARDRAVREGQVLRQLRAAGMAVPEVYAQFEEGGNWYLVLERIDGTPLSRRVTAGASPLSIAEAMSMCAQAARIVADVHRCRWVWRDIKASNFMLLADGTLRPVDFETAARFGVALASPWGSVGHLPPETMAVGRASVGQDAFALGALMHQIFTQELPGLKDRAPLRTHRPDAPAHVESLIRRLLSPNPSARPAAAFVARTLATKADAIGARQG